MVTFLLKDSDPIEYYTKIPVKNRDCGDEHTERPPAPTTLDELREIRDYLELNLTACTRIIAYLEKRQ